MKLPTKTVVTACLAGLSGIAVIVLVMWGYDYLDISRSAVWYCSRIFLFHLAIVCTWVANGRLMTFLSSTLGGVYIGACGMILIAYPGNANICVLYAAFLTALMTPATLVGCIIGYLLHKIHMRWKKHRGRTSGCRVPATRCRVP